MEIEVNFLAIFFASVGAMVVGAVWYSQALFGRAWMELVNLDDPEDKAEGAKAMAGMFVLTLVMAYVLSHITYMSMNTLDYTSIIAGLSSGFWMWLGFVVPTTIGGGLFEMRRKKLMLLNVSHWLVTLLVMGAIIGWFGFSS